MFTQLDKHHLEISKFQESSHIRCVQHHILRFGCQVSAVLAGSGDRAIVFLGALPPDLSLLPLMLLRLVPIRWGQ